MGLQACSECQQTVSDRAVACPHCGAPGPAAGAARAWGFEWRTEAEFLGWPLVHVAVGRNEEGRLRVARGVVAVGQFGVGAVTLAQFGVGFVFGFGQFLLAPVAVAQFAVALVFGLGQFASGYVAIGQMVLGAYGLCQVGFAQHLWSAQGADPEAVRFFCEGFAQLDLPVLAQRCGEILPAESGGFRGATPPPR